MFGLRFRSVSKGACIAAAGLAVTAFAPASYAAVAQQTPLAYNGAAACATGRSYNLVMSNGVVVNTPCPTRHVGVYSSSHGEFPRLDPEADNIAAVCVDGYRWIQHTDNQDNTTTVPLRC